MAKKQTRRTVSLARSVHGLLVAEAAARNVSAGELVEQALTALGLDLPETHHMVRSAAVRAQQGRWAARARRRRYRARGYVAVSRPVVASEHVVPALPEPAPAAPAMRPSLERQMLGDWTANAMGFR